MLAPPLVMPCVDCLSRSWQTVTISIPIMSQAWKRGYGDYGNEMNDVLHMHSSLWQMHRQTKKCQIIKQSWDQPVHCVCQLVKGICTEYDVMIPFQLIRKYIKAIGKCELNPPLPHKAITWRTSLITKCTWYKCRPVVTFGSSQRCGALHVTPASPWWPHRCASAPPLLLQFPNVTSFPLHL